MAFILVASPISWSLLTSGSRLRLQLGYIFIQVEVARASSELILTGLQPGTNYSVQVRVKLDGISYNGYWSAWSDPVFVETLPAGEYAYTVIVSSCFTSSTGIPWNSICCATFLLDVQRSKTYSSCCASARIGPTHCVPDPHHLFHPHCAVSYHTSVPSKVGESGLHTHIDLFSIHLMFVALVKIFRDNR